MREADVKRAGRALMSLAGVDASRLKIKGNKDAWEIKIRRKDGHDGVGAVGNPWDEEIAKGGNREEDA
jgi:hypothetical protein